MIVVVIMKLGQKGILLGEMIGTLIQVIGVTVKAPGVIMKKLTTIIFGKTKMEVVTGKRVWMEKNVGKMMACMIRNVMKKKIIIIVKVMAGTIMKTIMVIGIMKSGETVGLMETMEMIAL
jgi:hypothetical protein